MISCHCSFIHLFKKYFLSAKCVGVEWYIEGRREISTVPAFIELRSSQSLDREEKCEISKGKDCVFLADCFPAIHPIHNPENGTQQVIKMCLHMFSKPMNELLKYCV